MSFANIFPETPAGFGIVYPILASLVGSLVYAGCFEFGYNRIIEKIYAETAAWKMVYRAQFYLFIINLPIIILVMVGIIYNRSLLPMEVALDLDLAYIFIVCGYICFLEESRQTPIRGFVVLKDTIICLIGMGVLGPVYQKGQGSIDEVLTLLPVFMVAVIVQAFTNEIENGLLLALGIRQKNIYSASFLLTEKSQPSSFLQLKDIVSSHDQEIQQEIDDFISIATRLRKSNEQLNILINFARLFIPIKKAYELHEENNNKLIKQQYAQSWQRMEHDFLQEKDKDNDDETDKVYSFNNSASTLMLKKTFTTDSFIDDELERPEEESSLLKALRCLCYPLFLSTEITGRMRYFMDYLIVILICAAMFLLSNSISYFSAHLPKHANLMSLLHSGLLFAPISKYFVRISGGSNDYDFLGIFMGGMMMKIVAFSIGLAVYSSLGGGRLIQGGDSTFASLALKMGALVLYAAFLAWKRFAMRYNYLKIFIGIFTVCQLARVISESIMDYL